MPEMTRIHIIYTGIIALVPKYHHPKENGIQSIAVLVPNGEGRHHRHVCWLGCDTNQVEGTDLDEYSDPCKIESGVNETSRPPYKAYKVYGDMTISNALEGGLSTFGDGPGQSRILQLNDSDNNPYVASLNPAHLQFFVPEKLKLRTVISKGSFDVTYFDGNFKWAYHHKKNRPAAYRSLAQEVCHSFEISRDDSLRLAFKLGDRKSSLAFKSGEEKVVVVIGNTPEDDVLCTKSKPDELDKHVLIYNLLARASVNKLNHLVSKRADDDVWKDDDHNHGWAENRRYIYRVAMKSPVESDPWTVHGANCPPGWWEEDDGG